MPRSTPEPAAAELIEQLPVSNSLRTLTKKGELRRYAKGSLLIQEGDAGDALYLIVKGRLRAFSIHVTNGREITYGNYGPGEYVGEMGLDGGLRSASVMAVEPTVCAVISKHTLERHITDDPAFAFELLAKVIRRARSATLTARQMALNDVYGRLRTLIDTLPKQTVADGARRVAERLTHLELSRQLGCTREMVSRLAKDLERGGYLTIDAGHWVLRQPWPSKW